MIENIKAYIKRIDKRYQTGETTEHSFRGDLQQLLEEITDYTVINEQKRINCGAPDLTLYKNSVPFAYVEAKDLEGGDLEGRKKNKEQFDRYKASLNNIVFTDYMDFRLYEEGVLKVKAELAYIDNGHIVLNEDALPRFTSIIDHLRMLRPQEITAPKRLSNLMAKKARMLADTIEKVLANDTYQTGTFWDKLRAFKEVLNNDLDEKRFADLYAQTIAYGLFAARLHDNSPKSFTRQEAAELIPKTNPFLRQIFQQLAGYDINNSISWIVDDLVNIFAVTNVEKLRKNFGKEQQRRDPMIHFYEDFLSEYDPESKKKFGVYYTPQPVVEFIVRAVDDILKTVFNLPDGLADKSKVIVPIKKMENGKDVETITMEPRHRVQILDPATGTGTFLAEVVSRIKETQQAGVWPKYVDEHLLPRIHGFEIMMAPYTIAHLKLDMLINWWGDQKLHKEHDDRVQIYLTNSLTQAALANKYLLAEMIAREANEANNIKHNAPVMVMIGNPPYSINSSNDGRWIIGLLKDYKKNLKERNIQPLSLDYIKFIRLGQYYIERTGEGILAYISNNSFLDGLVHKQMRHELLSCFDDIYILNLHGDNRKNETAYDGSKDENVFDIMQGVSINIFIKKKGCDTKFATVHYSDIYGPRKDKYAFLSENSLSSVNWNIVQISEPNLFFVPKDYSSKEEYNQGFSVPELMPLNSNGIQTGRDDLFIDDDKDKLRLRIQKLLQGNIDDKFIETYNIKDSSSYNLIERIKRAKYADSNIRDLSYRPFDIKHFYYDEKLVKRSFYRVLQHMLHNNVALICSRQFGAKIHFITFVSENLVEMSSQPFAPYNVFPLYIYPTESELGFESERKPNLDETIWRKIENWVKYGQEFKPLTANEQSGELGFDAEPDEPHFLLPEDIFDYIYGVLHSPHYREKYKEFLKVDFPRIPYPKNKVEFEHYKEYGRQLCELHLMHNVPHSPVRFDQIGDCRIEQVKWKPNLDQETAGSVFINDKQYFSNVPLEAWEMYIGGYQPAQKWLKDRKGRVLSTEDIEHYEKIISVLLESNQIMQKMDNPIEQVEELKHKVQELEHQLQAKNSSDVHYHINANNVNLQTDGTINIGEINEK